MHIQVKPEQQGLLLANRKFAKPTVAASAYSTLRSAAELYQSAFPQDKSAATWITTATKQ
jgi:hypothetical protein